MVKVPVGLITSEMRHREVVLFPIAAVTDYHKLSGLKQHNFFSLMLLELRSPK